jgi:quinol monooxygenase YgiN
MRRQITQLATLSARPGCVDELVDLLRLVVAAAEEEPGTQMYAVFTSPASHTVWILEQYDDDGALQAHMSGETLARIRPRLHELRTGPPQVIPLNVAYAKVMLPTK